MKRGNGSVFRPPGSRYWHIRWSDRGERFQQSTNTESKTEAQRILRTKLMARDQGQPVGFEDKVTYDQLRANLVQHYQNNDLRSLRTLLSSRLPHLDGTFKSTRAIDITATRLATYLNARLSEGAARQTVKNELSMLRRMFTLGVRQGLVSRAPLFPQVKGSEPRKGFFERAQFEAVLRHLPDDLKPVISTAYFTGWRISEILSRRKQHLDLTAGWLRLEPGETKNGEGRMFPLTPELRAVLTAQADKTRALEREMGQIIPWLFHRQGKPIKFLMKAFKNACIAAGAPGRILHDFRRTAVRNLERAGVPRSAAMRMVGHKTDAIYSRYAIADEGMLREAGDKLATFQGAINAISRTDGCSGEPQRARAFGGQGATFDRGADGAAAATAATTIGKSSVSAIERGRATSTAANEIGASLAGAVVFPPSGRASVARDSTPKETKQSAVDGLRGGAPAVDLAQKWRSPVCGAGAGTEKPLIFQCPGRESNPDLRFRRPKTALNLPQVGQGGVAQDALSSPNAEIVAGRLDKEPPISDKCHAIPDGTGAEVAQLDAGLLAMAMWGVLGRRAIR